jgi:plasmid stability protein
VKACRIGLVSGSRVVMGCCSPILSEELAERGSSGIFATPDGVPPRRCTGHGPARLKEPLGPMCGPSRRATWPARSALAANGRAASQTSPSVAPATRFYSARGRECPVRAAKTGTLPRAHFGFPRSDPQIFPLDLPSLQEYGFTAMKTTLDLPDDLVVALKKRAAEQRRPLRALVEEILRSGLNRSSRSRGPRRLRRTTVAGGVDPGLDPGNRERMHDTLAGERP